MRLGTKTVLFGAHQFLLHPLFVALGWWKLYSFPFDPRLWFAFFLHDFGYFGKVNIDGPEGETHPEFGAHIMGLQFGKNWADFTMYHSRFYSRMHGVKPSKLCAADKLATALVPKWLYLFLVRATGEIVEYKALATTNGKYGDNSHLKLTDDEWYARMVIACEEWAYENKDTVEDYVW